MAGIDSLLRLVLQQGADELRVGVDREPSMFARGTRKRLSMPATSAETLKTLLGPLFTPETEQRLRERGVHEAVYDSPNLGAFRVKLIGSDAGFDAIFLHAQTHGLILEAEGPSAESAAQPAAAERAAGGPSATSSGGARHAAVQLTPNSAPKLAAVPHDRVREPESFTPPPDPHNLSQPNDRAREPNLAPARDDTRHPNPRSQPPPSARELDHLAQPPPSTREPNLAPARDGTRQSIRPSQPPHGAREPDHLAQRLDRARERGHLTQATALPTTLSESLANLIARAAELQASDLHLAEREPVCVRVHGRLQHLDADPVEDLAALLPLDSASRARLARGESLDLVLEVPDTARVRAHIYPAADGLVAALRLLPKAAPSFASLNMPLSFEDLIELPHGLVLVCGAAGSGKSTTLAALAQCALNRRELVMVTLEDPIEYTLTGSASSLVRRRQIGRDVRDFASGLRDALRADPEVLLLGEMRDPETIALALTAAETGHLVLATLHSGSAASAVERIIDAFPPNSRSQVRLQLAESLRAVVVQRLLRRARTPGRIPAIEVLRVTRAVASLIRDGKSAQFATVLQSNRREGMIALERSLADRVQAGDVRLEDAIAAANDPDSLSTFLMR